MHASSCVVHDSCINMRELCNQSRSLSVTLRNERVERVTAIFTATHAVTANSDRTHHILRVRAVSRRRSRDVCIRECSHVRKSFTRLAKISVSLYTCSVCSTNCRDAQTYTHEGTRKQQLTSCIYVANLMQLR